MEVQLGEIRGMLEGLSAIMLEQLPAKTAYWLKRAAQQLSTEFEAFEEARKTLVKQHAEIDEDGNMKTEDGHYILRDEVAFQEEYAEIAAEEVTIKYEPLSIEQLGEITITPNDLMKLGRLIKEEE